MKIIKHVLTGKPTQDTLTLRNLIALRAIPVGMEMITDRTAFIDGYPNSPANAKAHDSNHNRRFRSENQGYFERNGITTAEGRMKQYEEWNDTIQNVVLPSLRITRDMAEDEKNIRKAMILIYFEWLHEYAKTPDRASLITELTFKPDGPSAFEIVLRPGDTIEDHESRRLANKNLGSGAQWAEGQDGCRVNYFMDKGRNFLTSTYNKISNIFFDKPGQPIFEAPPMDARSPEVFLEATKRIMRDFKISAEEVGLTDQGIINLLTNRAAVNAAATESTTTVAGTNLETYVPPDSELAKDPHLVGDFRQSDAFRQGFALGS